MSLLRCARAVSLGCRRWCSTVVPARNRQLPEEVRNAIQNCEKLPPPQFADLLSQLSLKFSCDDDAAAALLTQRANTLSEQFNVDDLIQLCTVVKEPVRFTEMTRLLSLSVLKRHQELEDPAADLLPLWESAVEKDLALHEVIEGILDVLLSKSVDLTSDQLSGFVCAARQLPAEVVAQALKRLTPLVISSLTAKTSASAMCDIAYHYGTTTRSSEKDFWLVLMPQLTRKLRECSPADLANAALGVASCRHLEKMEKATFLARLAQPATGKLYKFSVDELAQLMEAFVKANCTHRTLFYDARHVLKRQVFYKNVVAESPKILFSLARLQQSNKHLLMHCLTELNDKEKLTRLPPHNISLLLYSAVKAGVTTKEMPRGLTDRLVDIVVRKWQAIPRDDFKLIAGCLDKLGFETRAFDKHKIMRLGNDAASTLALMNKWTTRDELAQTEAFSQIATEDVQLRQEIKVQKKRFRTIREEHQMGEMVRSIDLGVAMSTGEADQDVIDSDFINLHSRDDDPHRITDFLESKDAKKIRERLRGQPRSPAMSNPLPNNNMEPSMRSLIEYDTKTNL